MNVQLLYQNPKTGKVLDITTLVTAMSWKTVRVGSPGALSFTLLEDAEVVVNHGGIVALRMNGKGIFYGYIFKYSKDDTQQMEITAYDQLRYLKNKDSYVFQGKRADQIATQIARDFRIKTGVLANTGYIIPSMIEDSKTLFDILLKALDLTLIHKKEMYYLWDDYGALRISSVKDYRLGLQLGDGSLAKSFDYESSIDSDAANKIKLVRDNKDTGKREVFIVHDTASVKEWGILQHYDKVDEELNKAQIEERADHLLFLKNRPSVSLSIDAIADITARAGRAVYITIKDTGMSGWYIIDECDHDLMKETMKLKLMVAM